LPSGVIAIPSGWSCRHGRFTPTAIGGPDVPVAVSIGTTIDSSLVT
jgi:hypothetical protein